MTQTQILNASAQEVAAFLEEGRSVEQTHLRLALANAMKRIATLEERLPNRNATDEILNNPPD